MSKEPNEKGRIANLVSALKRLLAEDPLLFIVAVTCLVPLGGAIVATALSGNYMLVVILVLTMAAVVMLVVIPLVITKTWKSNQRDLNGERTDAVKEERVRRQASWEKSQERADSVINAKLINLRAQTHMLQDQSDSFQKFIIYEASKQFKDAVDERMDSDVDLENRLEAKFVDKFSIITDSFDVINKRYDNLVGNLSEVEEAIHFISKKEEKIQPEIIVKDKVDDPNEAISEARQIESLKRTINKQRNKITELEAMNEYTVDVEAMRKIPEVEISTSLPPTQNEVKETTAVDQLKAALNAVENITEPESTTEDKLPIAEPLPRTEPMDLERPTETYPDEPEDIAPEPIHSDASVLPNYWICPKCVSQNSLEQRRCSCGVSKVDAEKEREKAKGLIQQADSQDKL